MQSTRYAHTEGYTEIVFADDAKQFLTCGEDGDVRIWQGFDDIDSVSISIGEKCTSVIQRQNKFYAANELNEIRKYDFNTHEFEDLITTFSLPVTTMAINKSNTHMVCGSADFEIRLVDLSTLKYTSFTGHAAPILHICMDPLEKYFLSSSCDGSIRIWSIKNQNLVKTLPNMHEKSNDFSTTKTFSKISWHKDGNLIAVPANKEVQFFERELWQLKFKIETDSNVSITRFSPDGKTIALCTQANWIYVHSIITKGLLYKHEYTKKAAAICSFVWHPLVDNAKSEIIFCDLKGQMGCLKMNLNENEQQQDDQLKMEDLLEILKDDDNSNNSNSVSNEKIRSPNKKRKRLVSNEDDTNDTVVTAKSDKTNDDDGVESLERLKQKTFDEIKREMDLADHNDYDDDNTVRDSMKTVSYDQAVMQQKRLVYQHPFQPSSTGLNLNERFMCFNSVGTITQFNTDSDKSIIIEFHNVTYHHTIHIHNSHDAYSMATLCNEAILLASPSKYASQGDGGEDTVYLSNDHSKLTCILLNPWDSSNKEWSIQMPKKESIQCITVSDLFCACFTNNKFLRIFTHNGIQREIIALGVLSVIAMASYRNCIFISYYKAYSYSIDEHLISYSFIHLNENTNEYKIENGDLALSEKAKLAWLGFSDEGNPYYYDTNGFLYTKLTKCPHTGNIIWTPVCNLRTTLKHKSDNYWLVGITERTQNIKAIQCRSSHYPQTLMPKPTIQLVQFQLPLCEMNVEKSQFEHNQQKASILLRNMKTAIPMANFDQDDIDELNDKLMKQVRENLMKMFANACKANKEQRAFEYAQLMDSLTLQLAIKYATKSRHLQLAKHLNGLADNKLAIEQNEQYESVCSSRYENANIRAINDNSDECVEIIGDNKSQLTSQTSQFSTFTLHTDIAQTPVADTTIGTPSTLPMSNTRFNPFKTKGTPTFATPTVRPADGTSPSILTEIEDKLNKQQSKEKNVWKPTPTRKLTKNKTTTPNTSTTSKLDTFFSSTNKNKNSEANENLNKSFEESIADD